MATRTERDDDLATGDEPAAWDERPIFGTSAGLAWWGAILLGLGLTALGAAIDLQLNDKTPTMVTQGAYFVACVAAVCWVRRSSLFGPMVQPPLVLAVVLIGAEVYRNGLPKNFGVKEFLLDYGVPVINGFPTMAVTTGVTLLVGFFRLFSQRDPDRAERGKATPREEKPPAKRRRGEDELPPKRRRALPEDDALDVAAAAAPTRAARPVTPPVGRPAARGARAAGERAGRTTGENRLPAEGRRGARARPLEPRQQDSGARRRPPDSGALPHQQDSGARARPQESGPRPRPQDTGARARHAEPGPLAPRPEPRSARRQPPAARPWASDPTPAARRPESDPKPTARRPDADPQPEVRRAQPRHSGELPRPSQPPRKPLPPRGDAVEPPPRRTPGRRPPPPPRSRRWDTDDR